MRARAGSVSSATKRPLDLSASQSTAAAGRSPFTEDYADTMQKYLSAVKRNSGARSSAKRANPGITFLPQVRTASFALLHCFYPEAATFPLSYDGAAFDADLRKFGVDASTIAALTGDISVFAKPDLFNAFRAFASGKPCVPDGDFGFIPKPPGTVCTARFTAHCASLLGQAASAAACTAKMPERKRRLHEYLSSEEFGAKSGVVIVLEPPPPFLREGVCCRAEAEVLESSMSAFMDGQVMLEARSVQARGLLTFAMNLCFRMFSPSNGVQDSSWAVGEPRPLEHFMHLLAACIPSEARMQMPDVVCGKWSLVHVAVLALGVVALAGAHKGRRSSGSEHLACSATPEELASAVTTFFGQPNINRLQLVVAAQAAPCYALLYEVLSAPQALRAYQELPLLLPDNVTVTITQGTAGYASGAPGASGSQLSLDAGTLCEAVKRSAHVLQCLLRAWSAAEGGGAAAVLTALSTLRAEGAVAVSGARSSCTHGC